MTLFTTAQTEQLLANGRAQRAAIDRQDQALDFEPVVKLFTPDGFTLRRRQTHLFRPDEARARGHIVT